MEPKAERLFRHEPRFRRVALAWVLRKPAVASAVVGVHSTTQLNDLARAGSLFLAFDDVELVDKTTALEVSRPSFDFTRARAVKEKLMLN